MSSIKWLPLESNPDVMNKFLKHLGIPSKWVISDVISLDEELLPLVPTPVLALLLLFPTSLAHEEYAKKKEEETIQGGALGNQPYFMKQTIKNACGTVALIHSLANNIKTLDLTEGSIFKKFIEETKSMNPEEKGVALEKNLDIGVAHEASAQQGQTEAPGMDDDVTLHFIAIVHVDGQLYELDGRKQVPISHGSVSNEDFLKKASDVCKAYMSRDPDNLSFTVLSLGAAGSQ